MLINVDCVSLAAGRPIGRGRRPRHRRPCWLLPWPGRPVRDDCFLPGTKLFFFWPILELQFFFLTNLRTYYFFSCFFFSFTSLRWYYFIYSIFFEQFEMMASYQVRSCGFSDRLIKFSHSTMLVVDLMFGFLYAFLWSLYKLATCVANNNHHQQLVFSTWINLCYKMGFGYLITSEYSIFFHIYVFDPWNLIVN